MQRASERLPWMTDQQWACTVMLAEYVPGFSALQASLAPLGAGVELSTTYAWLSGFDTDLLTKLAIESTRHRLRLQIGGDQSGRLRLAVLPVDASGLPAGTGRPAPLKKRTHEGKPACSTPSLF